MSEDPREMRTARFIELKKRKQRNVETAEHAESTKLAALLLPAKEQAAT